MAITCKSKLSEILEDERACAIIDEYVPGFVSNPELGPVAGMKMKTLLKFPQTGLSKEQVKEICDRLDALDA